MPFYSFVNVKTKKIEDIFFHMKDVPSIGSVIKNDDGEDIKRIALKPNAAIDSIDGDPFDKNSFIKATNKKGGTFGSMFDLSKEFSDKRLQKEGIDPIADKYDKDRKEKYGLESMRKKKQKSIERLKKIGVSIKEKKQSR